MKTLAKLTALVALVFVCASCGKAPQENPKPAAGHDHGHDHGDHDHGNDHGDHEGHDHGDHDHGQIIELGTFDVGGIKVKAAQGHGQVAAGKEGHLAIKLPYTDKGATVIRAWIGLEDRTLSAVGKGHYTATSDDYEIHAAAPTLLPEGAQWWVEIEKPDGTKTVGAFPFK